MKKHKKINKKSKKISSVHEDVCNLIKKIKQDDNVGAYQVLNDILKKKCAKRISKTLNV